MVPEQWLRSVVNVGDISLCMLLASNLAIVYYFFKHETEEKPSLYKAVKQWPQEIKDRINVVGKYYMIGISILLLCSCFACNSESVQSYLKTHYILTTLATTIGLFLSMLFVNNFSYSEKYRAKLFFFIMHCILTTPTICTLGSEICLKAGLCTILLVGLLIATALIANQDFHLILINPLSKINGVVIVASIFVTVIGSPKSALEILLLCLNIHLGFFFFAGMFIVNVQLLLVDCQTQEEKFDPIYIAAVMEISTLNLFLRMATLVTFKIALRRTEQIEAES